MKYIEEYCCNFYHVKNSHGSFSINYFYNGLSSFKNCPMLKDKLKNFSLIYENGDNIITEYRIYDITSMKKIQIMYNLI